MRVRECRRRLLRAAFGVFVLSLLPAVLDCGRAHASNYLFGERLRVQGSLYELVMYRTDMPREEKQYRDTRFGLMRTKATLELLYKGIETRDTIVNVFGFFQYWHEATPDFDRRYRRSMTSSNRSRFQRPCYDRDDWINELYVDMYHGPWNLRLGKQIVFWSEVEMVRTIDRINPLDLRYTTPGIDPWDEMKLGLWMLRGFYHSQLPGQLSFEWIWIPGDFKQVRIPMEGTSMGPISMPQGPRRMRPRPFGQSAAVERMFDRARPAFTLRNSQFAVRIRGNSDTRMFGEYYLLDWTLSWFRGMNTTPVARGRTLGRPSFFNMDAGTLNGYLNRNAMSRALGLPLPPLTHRSLWRYTYFDVVGGSCQTYVPALKGVLRGELAYEFGVPVNKAFRKSVDRTEPGRKHITGTTRRDQVNVGITLDRPIRWSWLEGRWGSSGIVDCTVGWFGQWRLGNVNRVRTTFGYYDRSQTNLAMTLRTRLRHNELWPTLRLLYNTRRWGYGVLSLRYTPGSHWRYECGYMKFFARDMTDSYEASMKNNDFVYVRVGFEF